MRDTKERIIRTALELFSLEGYEAVSVRDIAGRLDISQSALYKHFASKRDIFDSIVERMKLNDRERSRAFEMPEELFSQAPQAYRAAALEKVKRFSIAQFLYWTQDEFAARFRRLITIEQYRSREMSELFHQYLGGGVVVYMEDIFREMGGMVGEHREDARRLALEFYSPIYMLMCCCDLPEYKNSAAEMAQEHIERFINEL